MMLQHTYAAHLSNAAAAVAAVVGGGGGGAGPTNLSSFGSSSSNNNNNNNNVCGIGGSGGGMNNCGGVNIGQVIPYAAMQLDPLQCEVVRAQFEKQPPTNLRKVIHFMLKFFSRHVVFSC